MQDRSDLTVVRFGMLAEPLPRLRVMQTQPSIQRPTYIYQPILGMLNQRPPLEAQGTAASIRLALTSWLRLEPMQLPPVPLKRRET